MATLYVYNPDSREVVARIIGDEAACQKIVSDRFGDTDCYAATYSPAFGASDGLIDTADCEDISPQ